MTTAPSTREAGTRSRRNTAASSSPPSVALEGWITLPWPSGTNRKPV